MATKQEQLDALLVAIRSGVRTVTTGETTTTFQNLADMQKVADALAREIDAESAGKTAVRRTVASFGRGF